jgi:hypothetical protein
VMHLTDPSKVTAQNRRPSRVPCDHCGASAPPRQSRRSPMERVAINSSWKSLWLLSLPITAFCNKICQKETSPAL